MLTPVLRRIADNQLAPVSLAGLAMQIRGEMRVLTDEPARKPPRKPGGPAVIIHCRDLQDAEACIRFATRQGLLIALSNGGSSSRGATDCDHGIAVDLSGIHATLHSLHYEETCRPEGVFAHSR